MTPQELEFLKNKVDQIKRLDSMMEMLARNPEDKLEELGEKVVSVLGRNSIDKRKDWVGEVAWVAVFNAIRAEREALRTEVLDRVQISECIHKVQVIREADT
jgi:hypothetical protein